MKPSVLTLLIFLLLGLSAHAQTDTTKVEVTEETAEDSDFSLAESYNYLVRAQVEETSLWKLGINSFGFISGGNPIVSIAYEQKLKPSVSMMAELKENIPLSTGWNTYHALNVSARFYYNMNQRIRKGKSANNFSANYLGVVQQNSIRRYTEPAYYYQPGWQVVFGLQRRLWKRGFADFNFGPGQQWEKGESVGIFKVNFAIGLAF